MAYTYNAVQFTPPSGAPTLTAIVNDFEDSNSHLLGSFQFLKVAGTYYQDNGITSKDIPLQLILTGENAQAELVEWRNALSEQGIGVLVHPDPGIGRVSVVVAGVSVKQSKLSHGEILVDVAFKETLPLLQDAISNTTTAQDILDGTDSMNESAATSFLAQFDEAIALASGFSASIRNTVGQVRQYLRPLASRVGKTLIAFDTLSASIINTADLLAREPLNLVRQIQALIALPATAINDARERFASYTAFAQDVFRANEDGTISFSGQPTINIPDLSLRLLGTFASVQYVAILGALAYTCSTIDLRRLDVNTTRSSLLDLLDSLYISKAEYEQLMSFLETFFNGVNPITQFTSSTPLAQQVVTLGASALLNSALSKNAEVAEEQLIPIHPLQACYNLYGDVSQETFSFFVKSNTLTGDEIFLIPKNRILVRY